MEDPAASKPSKVSGECHTTIEPDPKQKCNKLKD